MDSCIHVEIMVLRLDGSVPVKYGLRMSIDDRYSALKEALSKLCGLAPNELLLVEVEPTAQRSLSFFIQGGKRKLFKKILASFSISMFIIRC